MTATASGHADARPRIVHVVYRLDVGGLENGLVNLVNRLPSDAYRHTIVSLTDITHFRERIERDDVEFHALHKRPGHALWMYPRLYGLFRRLAPAIVHTRNLAALETTVPARVAGVPVRIHGEHGRDVADLDGSNPHFQRVRRLYRPFVTHYVALSKDLEQNLERAVGVPSQRISQIYNGVDTARFTPAAGARPPIAGCPFSDPSLWLVGWVGRMQDVKDPLTLARAFAAAVRSHPQGARMRLVMAGDGALRKDVEETLRAAGVADRAFLAGERSDVPDVLRGLDCFVLPSLAEGISNTVLEAMATGLPVIATRVGGNPELVDPGVTGSLVPSANDEALAAAIARYHDDHAAAAAHGAAARRTVVERFSLDRMVNSYRALYDGLLRERASAPEGLRAARPNRMV